MSALLWAAAATTTTNGLRCLTSSSSSSISSILKSSSPSTLSSSSLLPLLISSKLLSQPFGNTTTSVRYLLSSAYACEDAWLKQRSKCESLKHLTTERYFFELNQKYQQKQKVSAIDVDIFVNLVNKPENQEELEHIIKLFRATRQTTGTLESTHHAFCRFYLTHHKRQQLLPLLNNRTNVGIFPDTYCYNMLMDQAIKDGAYEDAVNVAELMMLQEDSGNEISKTLALYSLIRLLADGKIGPQEVAASKDGGEEEADAAAAAEEDDDEIEYIRVPFLTNPYFDDHFDINNRDHLFGKTLYFFGRQLQSNDNDDGKKKILSATTQIIGLVLYEKWSKLTKLLENSLRGAVITPEAITIFDRSHRLITGDETIKSQLNELKKLLSNNTVATNVTLESLVNDCLVSKLPSLEPVDIGAQQQLFAKFEQTRIDAINTQLDALLHEQKRKEIEQQKIELEKKKRLYYFFENFPKHEIDFVDAERRIAELQTKTVVDEDYIPPERY